MPYVLNHRTYWPLPFFLGEKGNPDLRLTDPVFAKFINVTAKEYGYQKTKSVMGLVNLESTRLMLNWFLYEGWALSLPVLFGFFSCLKQSRTRLPVYVAVTTTVATAICVFSQLHYSSPATVAVYVLAVQGLR